MPRLQLLGEPCAINVIAHKRSRRQYTDKVKGIIGDFIAKERSLNLTHCKEITFIQYIFCSYIFGIRRTTITKKRVFPRLLVRKKNRKPATLKINIEIKRLFSEQQKNVSAVLVGKLELAKI